MYGTVEIDGETLNFRFPITEEEIFESFGVERTSYRIVEIDCESYFSEDLYDLLPNLEDYTLEELNNVSGLVSEADRNIFDNLETVLKYEDFLTVLKNGGENFSFYEDCETVEDIVQRDVDEIGLINMFKPEVILNFYPEVRNRYVEGKRVWWSTWAKIHEKRKNACLLNPFLF